FTGLDLAARKFPKPCEASSTATLRAEHHSVPDDHGPDNIDLFAHSCRSSVQSARRYCRSRILMAGVSPVRFRTARHRHRPAARSLGCDVVILDDLGHQEAPLLEERLVRLGRGRPYARRDRVGPEIRLELVLGRDLA